jgi:8-oxo-dGTP pyrophosphatase MutT (NUDIX family)
MKDRYSICVPVDLDSKGKVVRVLLGLKKLGCPPMIGKYYAFGGHIEEGENSCQAMKRELTEENGTKALSWESVGCIRWFLPALPEWKPGSCYVYLVYSFSGDPVETDEMKPKWFNIDEIPYQNMWDDTKIWLPVVLEGLKFRGDFWYSKEKINLLTRVDFKVVGSLNLRF